MTPISKNENYEFRLLAFNAQDKNIAKNEEEEEEEEEQTNKNNSYNKNKPVKEFVVQMFGINEQGKTASIFVEGYLPFFYVKVDDKWTDNDRLGFIKQIKMYGLGEHDADGKSVIVSSKLLKKKKLYGFDGGKMHTFILIKFKNEAAMRKTRKLWFDESISESGEYKKTLKLKGYEYEGCSTQLYESNIPPLLRLFHIKEISPSGWIALPREKCRKKPTKTTSCTFEFIINLEDIISLPKKETIVPYKICSFDIEASSSHGDFPIAKKNYKKLATNITDLFINRPDEEKEDVVENTNFIHDMILNAFGVNNESGEMMEGIEKVYPIKPKLITKDKIDTLFQEWIKICPAHYKNPEGVEDNFYNVDLDYGAGGEDDDDILDDDNDSGGGAGAGGFVEEEEQPSAMPQWWRMKNRPKPYKKKGTILDLLKDPEVSRDTQIVELTRTLTIMFPKLQGDTVTFIGSTFMRYGEEKPYLNHCISLNTCTKVNGAVIESYKTEKEVLLAWTKIIQKEDPDIIIGYNIFGFDYKFMYERAQELQCEQKFLLLSRNNNQVCINKDWRTGKEGLEESTIVLASGQHDLKYVKMEGRVQIDMYNYFRRSGEPLAQYKLEYVSGYYIGDKVLKLEHIDGNTKIFTKNLAGLENGNFVNFEEEAHSVDLYKNGKKFEVSDVDAKNGTFIIKSKESPDLITKKVKWGLVKDDVSPQDLFRMTNEGPKERAILAKYCIQDCNLVHHLMRKIDVITEYVEMANLCSVPLDFIVMRGQSIKLTSYIAKKCREKDTLMPDINKGDMDEGYEGATVLEPKCHLYLDDPVACLDYGSLYPSSMISENISHDSKVLTREYDLKGNLLKETGEKDELGNYKYDHLPGYKYVDITYDAFKWQRKNGNPKAGMEKVKIGYKLCRFAQYPDGKKGIMPSILDELLAARKATRKLIPEQKDDFMKNVLDKRQLSIKVTANSMYGQTGAKTSSFYEIDCAASTTAIGRKLLNYAKRVIEEAYADQTLETKMHGLVKTDAEYVYGDTDSVFFKFNLKDLDGKPIIGQKALEITIELAQQAEELATKFLKGPHKLEYEKTFLPFCLLSKKRYVGMLYEDDPHKCKRKSMGIVLKRRDNAPIVKDIYGGVIDILMKEKNVERAVTFLKSCLQNMVEEKYEMEKLIITKSLRSGYKNPNQIAHKVLADRIGKRDAGNKPSIGDRVPYIYIDNPDKKALQGERIETPEFIRANKVKINYSFYITNQIMKPLQQLFALVLEDMKDFKKVKGYTLRSWQNELKTLRKSCGDDDALYKKKEDALRNKEVKALLFDAYLRRTENTQKGLQSITDFFGKK